ncbi:MAG: transglutaminase-like domain-containing protein [Methanobacteriaceae archaeon]|nr:transglutaminase-like domain-containing protein [Methanobacteriaceae archaeon]
MNQTSLENANSTSGGTIQNPTNTTNQTTSKTLSTSSDSVIDNSSSSVKNNTTYYNVTVKVPYQYWYKAKVKVAHSKYVNQKVKVKYKSYYKVKYKYHGKWYIKNKYTWKYKYVYKTVQKTYYTYTYKWTYQIRYKTETKLTTTKPTSSSQSISSDPYLSSSKNCQVTDSTIQSMAKKITSGATTYTAKATKIFNWVRDNLAYSFYYNTKYGAVKTLQYKKGNCVDHSHLMNALMRAVGIKTQYVHVNAKFTSGSTYGHVFSEAYVNGKWVKADATSSKNSFGVIKSWTLSKFKGYYSSLPF